MDAAGRDGVCVWGGGGGGLLPVGIPAGIFIKHSAIVAKKLIKMEVQGHFMKPDTRPRFHYWCEVKPTQVLMKNVLSFLCYQFR